MSPRNGKCRRGSGAKPKLNSPLCSTEGSSRHDGQPGPAHEISDSPGALRARSSDVDLILELPYGPAANFRAASEAGHMAAPDHAQRLSRDSSCTGGGVHTCPCPALSDDMSDRGRNSDMEHPPRDICR